MHGIGMASLYRARDFLPVRYTYLLRKYYTHSSLFYIACFSNMVAISRHVGDTAMLTFSAYRYHKLSLTSLKLHHATVPSCFA